jgi:hypothetical protein
MKAKYVASMALVTLSILALPQLSFADTYVVSEPTTRVVTPIGTGVTQYSWTRRVIAAPVVPIGTTIIDQVPTVTVIEGPTVVERTIGMPAIVEHTIEMPAVVERPLYVDRPVYVDRTIERPVYVDRVIQQPVVVEKPVVIQQRRPLVRLGIPGIAGVSLF